MGKTESISTNNIVKFTCFTCHVNTIYIKVVNYENNTAPFKPDQYICSECSQDSEQAITM